MEWGDGDPPGDVNAGLLLTLFLALLLLLLPPPLSSLYVPGSAFCFLCLTRIYFRESHILRASKQDPN